MVSLKEIEVWPELIVLSTDVWLRLQVIQPFRNSVHRTGYIFIFDLHNPFKYGEKGRDYTDCDIYFNGKLKMLWYGNFDTMNR